MGIRHSFLHFWYSNSLQLRSHYPEPRTHLVINLCYIVLFIAYRRAASLFSLLSLPFFSFQHSGISTHLLNATPALVTRNTADESAYVYSVTGFFLEPRYQLVSTVICAQHLNRPKQLGLESQQFNRLEYSTMRNNNQIFHVQCKIFLILEFYPDSPHVNLGYSQTVKRNGLYLTSAQRGVCTDRGLLSC